MLIAGGYLILDPDQIGLVLALSARIHVEVSNDSGSADEGIITVTSPQFLNAEWKYKCTIDEDQTLHVEDLYHPLFMVLITGHLNCQMITFASQFPTSLHI